jgi:hypothetical protein
MTGAPKICRHISTATTLPVETTACTKMPAKFGVSAIIASLKRSGGSRGVVVDKQIARRLTQRLPVELRDETLTIATIDSFTLHNMASNEGPAH